MAKTDVCILAAGMGRRVAGACSWLPKPLLPIAGKAMLSHVIDAIPSESRIIIAIGHEADLISQYVEHAYPNRSIELVHVTNYDGLGAGPATSLEACKHLLGDSFVVWAADTLVNPPIAEFDEGSWIATAMVNDVSRFCETISDAAGKLLHFRDKTGFGLGQASIGLMRVGNAARFWSALSQASSDGRAERELSSGMSGLIGDCRVIRVDEWHDVGTLDGYLSRKMHYGDRDFAKPSETTYQVNDRIVKLFADTSRAQLRANRWQTISSCCPNHLAHSDNAISYARVPGQTLYRALDTSTTERFVDWCHANLWSEQHCTKSFNRSMLSFYRDKTLDRIGSFMSANEHARVQCHSHMKICGASVIPLPDLLAEIDWDKLVSKSVPAKIHGDLQFDNVLMRDDDSFCLIDWREDFSGSALGDVYYDLAKLNGGLLIAYDAVRRGEFELNINGQRVDYRVAAPDALSECWSTMRAKIQVLGYDLARVDLVTALVYLSMAPMHDGDFGRLIFHAGHLQLFKALYFDA